MRRNMRVIGLGVLSGVLFGAVMGWLNNDVWAGLAGGATYGVFMAVVMRHQWGSTALAGLDRGQRRHVTRAMRRGEAVDDPKLARPLVESANATLAMPFPLRTLRVVFALLIVLGVAVAILDVVNGRAPAATSVLLALFGAVFLFVVTPWNVRQRDRAAQSRQATQGRWGDDPTG